MIYHIQIDLQSIVVAESNRHSKICEVPEMLFLPGNGRFGREFIYGSMAQKKLNPYQVQKYVKFI